MRLIDADKIMADIALNERSTSKDYILLTIARYIKIQPTIEAEPVRHGKWIRGDLVGIDFITEVYLWKCSECGEEFKETENNISHYHYCTNCGAKMDEVEE